MHVFFLDGGNLLGKSALPLTGEARSKATRICLISDIGVPLLYSFCRSMPHIGLTYRRTRPPMDPVEEVIATGLSSIHLQTVQP